MKLLKKGFLVLILLLSLFIIGCNNKDEKDLFTEFYNQLTFNENLSSSLDLKTEYNYKGEIINALWTSSNEKVLETSGKLNTPFEDEIVTLSVTLTCNNDTLTKDFEFFITGDKDKAFEDAFKSLNIPDQIDSSITLPTSLTYSGKRFSVTYLTSDSNVLTNEGKVTYDINDRNVNLTVTLTQTTSKESKEFKKNITVKKIDSTQIISEFKRIYEELNLINGITEDLVLPQTINYKGDELAVTWNSTNKTVLSNTGKISPLNEDTKVTLNIKTVLNISYSYEIVIKAMEDNYALEYALSEVSIPAKTQSNIILPTNYSYSVVATWSSSNENILSNTGVISKTLNKYEDVKLTLTLSKGESHMDKTFNICVANEAHLYQDRTFEGTKTNVHIENNKLVLDDNALEGSYETAEVSVSSFTDCVGSYAATSSKNATCELLVKVYSNNKWSKYLSYGVWGQGLKNAMSSVTDTYVKQVEDEIKMIGSNLGTKFQMKIVLRRDNLSYESPKVALLSLAIHYSDYTYNVDITNIPNEVKYDVPCLYQHDVPTIGNSICSATSSTMLLKYKGHNFEGLANYEHEYIAYIVKDYGNDIFGNWVYNTIGMSSFGETSYVKRFYSYQELLKHLATVGPVAASIKGTTITNKKTYTTAGHLIVVTGYKIDGNDITMYINDPNVSGVQVTMTLQNFLNVYRMVSYIVE